MLRSVRSHYIGCSIGWPKKARKQREMHQKCTTFQMEYQVFFSESVPILDCQKVGLLSKISSSSKFSSSARVMSVLLIYQSILVDEDDLVHGRRRQGASSGVQSDQPPRRPARTERLLPAWPGRLLPTSITWDRFVVATLVRSPACTKRIYHLKMYKKS